ncbi:MAG: anthranilate synthase component II [Egibacteraceae bacterium]
MAGPTVFVVDNYDSFTYNLVQQLSEHGARVTVARNDAFGIDEVESAAFDGIVISPGPGTPADAGLSSELVRAMGGRTPLLGVCLGHQCIGEAYGGRTVRAPELRHGKTSPIEHDGRGVFTDLPQSFPATRYHSLVIDPEHLPADLTVTAYAGDVIMGVRHRRLPVEGVQFHPESILTLVGPRLLGNFLERVGASVRG